MPSTAAQPGYDMPGVDPQALTGGNVGNNLKFGTSYLDAIGKSQGFNSVEDWANKPDAVTRAPSAYYSGSTAPTPENLNYAQSIQNRAKAG